MMYNLIFKTIVAFIITGVLVPYIQSETAAEHQSALRTLIRTAVAAEQIYIGTGRGREKSLMRSSGWPTWG
jgi:hypothetical protein